MAPTPVDAVLIGKIAALIESTNDGEALCAARMLVKRLGGHGLRISDVIERGVSGVNEPDYGCASVFRSRSSPPSAHHRTKIDALLNEPAFMWAYLTRKSLSRLQSLYRAPHVDSITMGWIDGLLEKAREMRAGRAA